MAILELIAIWLVISGIVGMLIGVAIHRIDDDASLPNGGPSHDLPLSDNHDATHGTGK